MSYKINVASYLTKATVGSGLKIFIFFFWRRGEQGHTGRRTRILNLSSSLRASLKHLPSSTTACLFRIILVSESSTRSQNIVKIWHTERSNKNKAKQKECKLSSETN